MIIQYFNSNSKFPNLILRLFWFLCYNFYVPYQFLIFEPHTITTMFEDVVDSKYSADLLSFFLLSPPRTYSFLELSKRLRFSQASLSKAINHLQSLSMIKQLKEGKTRYFIVNEKHKLLPDIRKSLVRNQKPYEDELFVAVKKLGDVQAAFLSGVFTGHSELPVDILIVGKINLSRLSQFLEACKKMMGRDVNYSIMTPEEFKLRRDTFDRFIKDVFDYPHITILDRISNKRK